MLSLLRWREKLPKYAYLLWWGSLGLLVTVFLGSGLWVLFSGGSEAESAFASGRRLLIALDTGEVKGKIITLDAPVPLPPASPPSPTAEQPPAPPTEPTAPDATPSADALPADAAPEASKPDAALPPATPTAEPNPALMEKTAIGNLPVIGSDGTKPWRYYSKAFKRERNQPMVAIIISGLGIGRDVTQEALALPENITLSFSPYTRDVSTWSSAIRATGHELLLEAPLEPTNYPATDPGPNGMLLEKGPAEAEKGLQWVLSRFPAFIGVMTPQNESFTANDEAMKTFLQSLANRGLLVVLSHEPAKKETRDILDASQNPAIVADISIDEELSPTAIQTRLLQLEEQAKKHGYAVGVAQAYPLTVEQLKLWSQTLAEKGVILVPASAIAKLRFS